MAGRMKATEAGGESAAPAGGLAESGSSPRSGRLEVSRPACSGFQLGGLGGVAGGRGASGALTLS